MTHILRRLAVVLFLSLLGIHLSGCAWTADLWDSCFGAKKSYELRIYRFSTRKSQANKDHPVEYLPGRFIYLEPEPVIRSKDIRQITVMPHFSQKGKSLVITLDYHGRAVWTQLTAVYHGSQVVCMLDNQYMGPIELKKLNESGKFVVLGPFTDEEADKIVKKAPSFR